MSKKVVQVIDLFCGCGGMSIGFMKAKTRNVEYKLLCGIDIDKYALATYERYTGAPAINEDVSNLKKQSRIDSLFCSVGYAPDLPLVVIGCAPCQGFSSHQKKNGKKDSRNALIEILADVVELIDPDVFLMENVPEIFYKKNWSHYDYLRSKLSAQGFSFNSAVHNVAYFGVPQQRFRALVVGAKNEWRTELPKPTRSPSCFVTVRDAIGALPPLQAGEQCPSDLMHKTSNHREKTIELLKRIPLDGGSRNSLPEKYVRDCHKSVDGFRDVYGRLWWDKPSVSITARCRTPSCGRFVHPEQHRGLSIREAALLQGFPPDIVFEGPFDDKFKQIGNAVPPVFAMHVAENLDYLWDKEDVMVDKQYDVVKPIAKSISSSLASIKKSSKSHAIKF